MNNWTNVFGVLKVCTSSGKLLFVARRANLELCIEWLTVCQKVPLKIYALQQLDRPLYSE